MRPIEINGRTYSLKREAIELPPLDLIPWLSHQSLYPKVYWKERDSHITRAAIGSLLSFTEIPRLSFSEGLDLRLYGGMRFGPRRDIEETWRGFPSTCFWLPEIEISQEEHKTVATFYSLNERALAPVPLTDIPPLSCDFSVYGQTETPDYAGWKERIDHVLREIERGRIQKLVLCRKTSVHFSHTPSAWSLLSQLAQRAKRATVFAFQLTPGACFFGATPETLFQRRGSLLRTEAVASTRPRGDTREEDQRLEEELLCNPKEKREFAIVREFLEAALTPLSLEVHWEGPDRILKASHVQHIYNRLTATLKGGIADADLIRTLHPTPALGGSPKEASLAYLSQIEPFDRGWYGAPVGVIGPQGASLYVAIRSALLRERTLHLFSGTGIVEGSVAEREWEELDQKIRPFTEQFSEETLNALR